MKRAPRPAEGGLLAAGVGKRFQDAGVSTPKPLLEVGGRPLAGWVLAGFRAAGLKGAFAVLHPRNKGVAAYARAAFPGLALRFQVKATASTLETFVRVLARLQGPTYLLATADALFPPAALKRFAARAARLEADVVLGVTRHRVDASSLRARVDRKGAVLAMKKGGRGPWATAGIYWLSEKGKKEARAALRRGTPSLSSFLSWAPTGGLSVAAVDMGPVFDVDRPEDLRAAQRALSARRRA